MTPLNPPEGGKRLPHDNSQKGLPHDNSQKGLPHDNRQEGGCRMKTTMRYG